MGAYERRGVLIRESLRYESWVCRDESSSAAENCFWTDIKNK